MKKVVVFLFIWMISIVAAADYLSNMDNGFVSSKQQRGFFSIGFIGAYQSSRLINQDGTYSAFTGSLYGLSLEIGVMGSGAGEFRIFGTSLLGTAKNNEQNTDLMNRSETLYGIKIYTNPHLFMAAGYGNENIKTKNSITEVNLINKTTALGLGLDFQIKSSWFLSLQGWYKSGPIKKDENTSLTGNSGFDAAEGHLVLIWSPPMTTVNVISGK